MQTESGISELKSIRDKAQIARDTYPAKWEAVIGDWCSGQNEDAAWLTYSANYLLRTDGFLWALDPFSLFTRIGGGTQPDFQHDLAPLQAIVLTHEHNDHLDLNIISSLQDLPITWIVPDFMLEKVISRTGLHKERITIPTAGKAIPIGSLILTPFESKHFRGKNGVPELGYKAEFSGKRWLFPGDIRSFEPITLPDLHQADGVAAHLWLGKGCALDTSYPLLPEFCRYFQEFLPRQIIVTHMEELGRDERNCWNMRHFEMIVSAFKEQTPFIKVFPALTGQKFLL